MEQKLFKVSDIDKKSTQLLEKYMREGWIIKDISACATSLVNCCWVLLERPLNSPSIKSN